MTGWYSCVCERGPGIANFLALARTVAAEKLPAISFLSPPPATRSAMAAWSCFSSTARRRRRTRWPGCISAPPTPAIAGREGRRASCREDRVDEARARSVLSKSAVVAGRRELCRDQGEASGRGEAGGRRIARRACGGLSELLRHGRPASLLPYAGRRSSHHQSGDSRTGGPRLCGRRPSSCGAGRGRVQIGPHARRIAIAEKRLCFGVSFDERNGAMANFTPVSAAIGGALIGLSAVL